MEDEIIFLNLANSLPFIRINSRKDKMFSKRVDKFTFAFAFLDEEESGLTSNWRTVKRVLIAFILILIVCGAIGCIGLKNVDYSSVISLPFLVITVFMQIALFFGEEYGWRGFLQEKMQKNSGKGGELFFRNSLGAVAHADMGQCL